MSTFKKKIKPIWKQLQFAFKGQERATAKNEFSKCSTIEEYWQFSKFHFDPTQIKNEIIPFLEYCQNTKPTTICEIGWQEPHLAFQKLKGCLGNCDSSGLSAIHLWPNKPVRRLGIREGHLDA